jgi:hypothetical protein
MYVYIHTHTKSGIFNKEAIKKSEIMSFTGKWVDLEIIMLSEISQAQRDQNHMLLVIRGIYT